MEAEVWFRNFRRNIGVFVEEGVRNYVWHRGTTIKNSINPVAFHQYHSPPGLPWRAMVVGVQGAIEYNESSTGPKDAKACYPVWHLGDPIEDLEMFAEQNVAEIDSELNDESIDPFFRPRPGQEHRIVIINVPDQYSVLGRRVLSLISEVQKMNPQAILHLFEAGTYKSPLASGLGSFDFDVCIRARMGEVVLPMGKRCHAKDFSAHKIWFDSLGVPLSSAKAELDDRIRFGIRSAHWAAKNWDSDGLINIKSGLTDSKRKFKRPVKAKVGDKIACDYCSLFDSCKMARDGGVCTLPEAETVDLANYFKTRDADKIIDGLGAVLSAQAQRAEAAIGWEQETEKLDPELTKVLKAMAEGGEKLAKLIDPSLSSPKIALQINQGSGSTAVVAPNMKVLMANAVKELENRGIPRSDITPDMVMMQLTGAKPDLSESNQILDAEVVE
jgi:hypothetical protein